MNDRPRGSLAIASLFGIYSTIAGALVVWALLTRTSQLPFGFVVLDVVIVGSGALTALGAWRLATWTASIFAFWLVLILITLWGHILYATSDSTLILISGGAIGSFILLLASWFIYRYLRNVTRPQGWQSEAPVL